MPRAIEMPPGSPAPTTTSHDRVGEGRALPAGAHRGRGWEPSQGSHHDLLAGLRSREPRALAALMEHHGKMLTRVLASFVRPGDDLRDMLQDTYEQVLISIHQVREPAALERWLVGVAVHVAQNRLRRRRRRWWEAILPGERVPEPETAPPDLETSEALRCTYEVLQRMPDEERIVFGLRIIDAMPMEQVAQACGVSLATAKRRLSRAQQRFLGLASRVPALQERLGGGSRPEGEA